jgi:hypothetical protein
VAKTGIAGTPVGGSNGGRPQAVQLEVVGEQALVTMLKRLIRTANLIEV